MLLCGTFTVSLIFNDIYLGINSFVPYSSFTFSRPELYFACGDPAITLSVFFISYRCCMARARTTSATC